MARLNEVNISRIAAGTTGTARLVGHAGDQVRARQSKRIINAKLVIREENILEPTHLKSFINMPLNSISIT